MVELWDFYYSAKQCEIRESLDYRPTFLNDKRYTECCDKGDKPIGNFDDYIFIGTGTINDIKIGE